MFHAQPQSLRVGIWNLVPPWQDWDLEFGISPELGFWVLELSSLTFLSVPPLPISVYTAETPP